MKTKRFCFSCLIILFFFSLAAQQENLELQQQYNRKLQYKQELYNKTLDFIHANPNSPQLAELYFNLAELSSEINLFKPWITAEYYLKVLEHDPDHIQKDIILYNIGFYSYKAVVTKRDAARIENIDLVMNWPDSLRLSEEKLKPVIAVYKTILLELPDSPYNTDAAYRLGRIYFDLAIDARIAKKYFEEAIYYFNIVAERENDPLQYYGLFQRGWTYFASTQFSKAIEDFSTILGILDNADQAEKKTFFLADAIENIAFSLIEYDGTDFVGYSKAAEVAAEILRSCVEDKYGQQILEEAVKLKRIYNAPMQAVDLYKTYLLLYPSSKNNPAIIDSIITIYRQNPTRLRNGGKAEENIIEQMHRLTTDFTIDSNWYEQNKNKNIESEMEIIQAAFAFLEPKYLNNFLRNRRVDDYKKYEQLVINYTAYPEFSDPESTERKQRMRKNIVDLSQDLAEVTENPAHYLDTIIEIDSYIERQTSSAGMYHYYELRFYNYEKLYNLLNPIVQIQEYVDEENNIRINKVQLDSLLISAASDYKAFLDRYEQSNPDLDQQLIKVTYLRAELYYENNMLDKAAKDYRNLLKYPIQNELKLITYSRLAEISQTQQNYDDAEFYFREASKFAVENDESFENNILAALLAKAKAYEAASDFHQAAQQYRKIAAEFEIEKPAESTAFIMRAIENYKKAGENQQAIDLYLQIASQMKTSGEVLSAYLGAWSIADSLKYWQQSIDLRREFMKLYPNSNEAYKLRLHIIGFYESEKMNNKRIAAQLLEDLHEDSDTMDLGNENPANILLQAIKLYKELNNEKKVFELSIKFDEFYPDHEKANDLLVAIAKKYKENGEEENYEKIASRLYAKDPNLDLLVEVAVNKLKDIKEDTDKLFEEGNYDLVLNMINNFNQEEGIYKKQGLNLPTDHIHETFDYYQKHIDFHIRFQNALRSVQQDIINKTAQELIKVNELTKWKDHLAEGESRIPGLMKKCDELKDEFIRLIQEGNNYDLSTSQRTEALYKTAKAYDYSGDVVITQVQKFLDVSIQLNNAEMKSNPIQQQQYKTALKNNSLQLANEFRKKAVQIYQTLLKTFYDDKEYTDEWIEKSLNRLLELGVRKKQEIIQKQPEQITDRRETIITDKTWLAAGSSVRFDADRLNKDLSEFCSSLVWLPAGKANFQYFKQQMFGLEESPAEEIWFSELDTVNVDIVYFKKLFILPEKFENTQLKILGQHMITIWANNEQLLDAQGIVYDDKMKKVQVQKLDLSNLKPGENEIVIEVIGADYYKGLIAEISYKAIEVEE